MKSGTKCRQAVALAVLMLYAIAAVPLFLLRPETALADEARYCADDDMYGGEGESVDDNYYIYHDYKVTREKKNHPSAPTYSGTILNQRNICAPVAGLNVAVYYDRYYPNLIPNFEPGMVSSGTYRYFPDLSWTQTDAAVADLYSIMNTNQGAAGTSNSDFKNGLVQFFGNHGYSMSYSSFYGGSATVNFSALTAAVDQGKVGLILCSRYNFVYDIGNLDNGTTTYIVKTDSNIGHIMMIYGYMVVDYYQNGAVFQTDTFLYASSGFSSGKQGYVLLNDYLSIDEALIVNVA